jgi:hypothetical protein
MRCSIRPDWKWPRRSRRSMDARTGGFVSGSTGGTPSPLVVAGITCGSSEHLGCSNECLHSQRPDRGPCYPELLPPASGGRQFRPALRDNVYPPLEITMPVLSNTWGTVDSVSQPAGNRRGVARVSHGFWRWAQRGDPVSEGGVDGAGAEHVIQYHCSATDYA